VSDRAQGDGERFPWVTTLLLFAATRLALTLVGVVSRLIIAPWHPKNPDWIYSKRLWLELWGTHDTGWYLSIANRGYMLDRSHAAVTLGQSNYGFFPLYPLLMRWLGWVTGDPYTAGLLISNVACLGSAYYLWRLVRLDADRGMADRSVLFLFLGPLSFILSSVFTEALFLCLTLASFWHVRRGEPVRAGLFGGLTALTRPAGVFIIIPLIWEELRRREWRPGWGILGLLLIPAGLTIHLVYCCLTAGDFFYYARAQANWGRGAFIDPLSAMARGLSSPETAEAFSAWFGLAVLALLLAGAWWLRTSYFIFGLYTMVLPVLGGGLMAGLPRYSVVVFPLLIVMAGWCRESPGRERAVAAFLAILQGFLMVTWANGLELLS
jgi:hypothetical protein